MLPDELLTVQKVVKSVLFTWNCAIWTKFKRLAVQVKETVPCKEYVLRQVFERLKICPEPKSKNTRVLTSL